MEFKSQQIAIQKLDKLVEYDTHSILISGIRGCGKTYLAAQFAAEHNISTFHSVQAKVSDLKNVIEDSYKLQDKQVLCIENLDDGTEAASQIFLKYLEEPSPNVYIVITCVNSGKVPSTILSRAIEVKVQAPYSQDLLDYGLFLNRQKFQVIANYEIFKALKSFTDVRTVVSMTMDQIKYYSSLLETSFWKSKIDEIMWNLSHYSDNSKTDLKLVFRIIQNGSKDSKIRNAALDSLLALESKRLSETAIIGKFVLSIKD